MDTRYKQLKKENDSLLLTLSDSYKNIATIYVKKARGYAVRSEDTEVKVRDTLYILRDFDERSVPVNIAVPSMQEFIEGRVNLLSKQYKDPDRIKGIIWLTAIILVSIVWIVVGEYFARRVYFDKPANLKVAEVIGDKVKITWDEVINADKYQVYYVVDGQSSSVREVSKCEFTFTVEKGKEYTFCVYVEETKYFGESPIARVIYTLPS